VGGAESAKCEFALGRGVEDMKIGTIALEEKER
jgi:hypothetical protein